MPPGMTRMSPGDLDASKQVARRAGVDCRERSTPAAEASLNQLPHASPGLLPLGHYCFNKPASAYLQAGDQGVHSAAQQAPLIAPLGEKKVAPDSTLLPLQPP